MRRLPKQIDEILVRHIQKYPYVKPITIPQKPKSLLTSLKELLFTWKK